MDQSFKIALLPMDIVWADRSANLDSLERAMASLDRDTDLAVLPELFTTGFIPDRDRALEHACAADEHDDSTLRCLRRLASEHCCAIAGSYLRRDTDGGLVNYGVVVEPSGEYTSYSKRHLFCLSQESRICEAGRSLPPVVRYRGMNISMVICYDLRFPAWCRNQGLRYDILLIPANWPVVREYAWHHLLIARAIENQAIVVGANRSGHDDYGDYDGTSQVYDYMGKPLCMLPDDPKGWIYATVNKAPLEKYRTHFPFSSDADSFEITDC